MHANITMQPAEPLAIPATVAVVLAHPDDETITISSLLANLSSAMFIHITDGAPPDGKDATENGFASSYEYARARREELVRAVALCGIPEQQLLSLACPDQMATICMADLARQLCSLLRRKGITSIITHAYEGGHPDHDATAFAVHAAAAMLVREHDVQIEIIEAACYHLGNRRLESMTFLPSNLPQEAPPDELVITLTTAQQRRKRLLIECFTSQRNTLAQFPLTVERLRPAPRYDFTAPPHDPPLLYEQFPWGTSWEGFIECAGKAMRELGLQGSM